jgi:fatty acid desaturase
MVSQKFLIKRDDIAIFHLLLRISYHFLFIFISCYFYYKNLYFLSFLFALPNWIVFSFFGFTGLSHELFHYTVFTNKNINKFLCYIFMVLVWENYSFFKITHWKHHTLTLDDKDPEPVFKGNIGVVYLIQLFSFDFKSFYNRVLILFKNSFGFVPLSLVKLSEREIKDIKINARVILFYIVISLLIFVKFKLYPLIFLVTLSPFIITFFNKILAFAQHYGLSSNLKNDYFANSRTIILNPFWNFFYSSMNYHVEHHFSPMVPYYNLNNFHDSIKNHFSYVNLCRGWRELITTLNNKGLFSF